MSELFDAVDALVASRAKLPPPAERKRLRAAHGLTIEEVAAALKVRRATVSGWEAGKTEPRPPERDAYARLLDKLAELYPADAIAAPVQDAAVPATFTAAPAPAEARTLSTGQAPEAADMTEPENTQTPATAPVAAAPAAAPRPARTPRTSSTSRRPGAKKAAPAGTPAGGGDPRFENGPLAVVDVDADGQVLAYCTGG
ncbi:helix-turn-helix transcriptional regulator, partial [Streptomyces eurythermus]